ncbi:MAG: glycosyl transferase [Pseudopedobacter saltans]|uniref:Glycosyl transferase n=1 Tax=Pseudopedobacter saltans TaxID=151895 RepID=A0A2W5EN11_9SPHI|nr:MAG: glycosyl transferase [Pseudopedobacter saltans]
MKIFYAVQATGNGHIARVRELIPYLKKYGTVDIFLSGENCSLDPGFEIAYRSKGLGFFYNNTGGLDYLKTLKSLQFSRVWKEAHQLPIEKYDIVINDFESITALACMIKKIPSTGFGHQASFQSSKVPRPNIKNAFGELVLKKYAPATNYIGLHFEKYDSFIHLPVIKNSIQTAKPTNKGHVTVYLSHYGNLEILKTLEKFSNIKFEVFSPKVSVTTEHKNVIFYPIDNKKFTQSVLSSHGVITGAGFETPAEVLYLGKKLICLPIKNQYEQLCNAEALKSFHIPILKDINRIDKDIFQNWYESEEKIITQQQLASDNFSLIENVMEIGLNHKKSIQSDLPITSISTKSTPKLITS